MTTKRIIIAVLAAAGLCWAAWQSAASGLARTLGESALATAQADSAARAVRLTPNDAELHCVLAVLLEQTANYPEAQMEVERAVQLRPRDFSVWLLLGITRDENQDQDGALRAFRQASALAPAYAQPHWLLGNLLLRMEQTDEAFKELRMAASSDPQLLPNVIDLAWGIYHGDLNAVLAAVPSRTDAVLVELALYLSRHGQSRAAADQFLLARVAPSTKAEAVIAELLNDRAFADAYRVWARARGVPSSDMVGSIRDAGFEEPIAVGATGFGWQIKSEVQNVMMSVDATEHHTGAKSLRIEFRGDSNPTQSVLTQLILVKPLTKYRLTFAAMGRDLVSAALPIVAVRDASDSAHPLLGQSPELRADVTGWRDFSIDITTGPKTEAILLSVERQRCNDPCPAFGVLWIDSFGTTTSDGTTQAK